MASTDTADRFGFGANWADYIEKNFSKDRLDISKTHLLEFLKLSNLEGKTFFWGSQPVCSGEAGR